MYSIFDYGTMIADEVRMDGYVRALRRVVNSESVVLDIGTGTGIFALLACQLGARRVYAIEPDDAIHVAREIAVANGCAERINFIQDLSTQITLPDRATVMVSDIGGLLPWFKHHIPSIIDARKRLLVPGGAMIPSRDAVYAAVIEAPELYGRFTDVWHDPRYGLEMEAARRIVVNTWRKGRLTREHLLVEPQCWATLDYDTVMSPDVHETVSWTVAREGTGHGLGLWFQRTLAEGVHLHNAPGAPKHNSSALYSTVFFPWCEPVALTAGDAVSVTLQADLVGDDYIWCWDTHVLKHGNPGKMKAEFKQSNFFGVPLCPTQLSKQAANYVPTLNERGRIDRLILESMNGCISSGEIARSLLSQFPSHFPTWRHALSRVGEVSKRYSQ
jgi:protein arginine N-methyltransferase 1